MSIDYSRLRSATARQFASALHEDGFELQRQKGSHRHYRHLDGRRVTLSYHHSSDTFPIGTLRSIVELQAQWSEPDLVRLGLLRLR
jgi:predicted RNA binding protein YcfA (HicA-like mRNA interferase family)